MLGLRMVIFVGALLAWAAMIYSWFAAVANRADSVSLPSLIFNGFAFFDSDNFTEKGLAYRRRYFWSLTVFFMLGVAWIATSALQ